MVNRNTLSFGFKTQLVLLDSCWKLFYGFSDFCIYALNVAVFMKREDKDFFKNLTTKRQFLSARYSNN